MTAERQQEPRPRRPGLGSQVGRFAAIGIASTAAYLGLYSLVRSFEPAALTNAAALFVTTIGNTAANRRLTYVASGQLRYALVGGTGGGAGGGPGGNSSTAWDVGAWVISIGKVVDYGGSSGAMYDLSGVATTGS